MTTTNLRCRAAVTTLPGGPCGLINAETMTLTSRTARKTERSGAASPPPLGAGGPDLADR